MRLAPERSACHHKDQTRKLAALEGKALGVFTLNETSAENGLTQSEVSAHGFVASKLFSNLFAMGMELVEETATYLDTEGRDAAKQLPRKGALAYAGASMRLTTRLMQIASWLLVLRALRDKEMSYEEASNEKYRLGTPEPVHEPSFGNDDDLPELLINLIGETDQLYARIARIDTDLFTGKNTKQRDSDAMSQLKALQAAFPDDI